MNFLTAHERRIIALAITGMGYLEVSKRLKITLQSTKTAMYRIFHKTGSANLIELSYTILTDDKLREQFVEMRRGK
jgi:DNA-binding NarL/FixJ family response regulator